MKHFIIDFETLGLAPNPILVELSAIVFDPTKKDETFQELVDRGLKIKFDIKSQQNGRRYTNKSTLDFWKSQSEELRQELLLPSSIDVDIKTGLKMLMTYLKENGIDNQYEAMGWCRGQSFDFPILIDMIREVHNTVDVEEYEICKFWNQCDIRSYIRGALGTFDVSVVPILKKDLPGFTAHNSIHDCAKDVMMIKRAYDISRGGDLLPVSDMSLYETSTIRLRELEAFKNSFGL